MRARSTAAELRAGAEAAGSNYRHSGHEPAHFARGLKLVLAAGSWPGTGALPV
ncbi:hypothetical protein KCP70_08030 [Salmonella enterica subsp. enterica]|nr:hypothetical protein KCP70_08030 [Salmonella enterica subsp. enterica]